MKQTSHINVQSSPVWNEVKNWNVQQKAQLIKLLYASISDEPKGKSGKYYIAPQVKELEVGAFCSEPLSENYKAEIEECIINKHL